MKANRALVALTFLLVAGCEAVPPPAPAPPPRVAPPPPAPPAPVPPPAPADWRDAPQTPGTWSWAIEGGRSTARFGVAGGAAVISLSCDRQARVIKLWRTGSAQGSIPLIITSTEGRGMVTGTSDPAGGAHARLPAGDALLDAAAFSRGRFMVEMPGNPALYLPSWPEITRVIEDCRKG